MNRNFKDILKLILALSVGVSLLIFTFKVWEHSDHSLDTTLWLRSAEKQLLDQNERYAEDMQGRYSILQRDLTNYQLQTNLKIEALEVRILQLEEVVRGHNESK